MISEEPSYSNWSEIISQKYLFNSKTFMIDTSYEKPVSLFFLSLGRGLKMLVVRTYGRRIYHVGENQPESALTESSY